MSSISEKTTDGAHGTPSTTEQLSNRNELDAPLQEPHISIATDPKSLTGGRLHLMTLGSHTSLLAIIDSLKGYRQAGWVLTSYLLTYTGFIIVWAKLSDIFGRKTCSVASLAIFTIFSGACGGAQTMTQLIIFRAFQGLGAAGGFALTILIINEMVPRNKLPMYGAIMALDMALATLSGPLFGGVISDRSTWRWVFLMNIPGGGIIANLSVASGRIPVIYVALFFSATTAIGTGLLTTLPTDDNLPKAVYAYEALAGLGGGATFALVILLVPYVVEKRDLATANGALIEFRILGGAIGLAIVASALENYLNRNLGAIISPEQRVSLMESTALLHELPDDIRGQVIRVFAEGFSLQMKITTAFAALQVPAIVMFWKKKQITVEKKS
ncbi:uncharacterized protein N0V89_009054 [Didymosphaeria variabile]|uniref:Major facilitator superfamily (MFS) profile domain-containing protein n=1 Tax=Didymosphaeria variabile TaxID=1932322 RepID=A0A9W8XHF0_9PLEO|nr:uncharacterized protein N0V89_009054 [Didymosphaeria variabile]KAJ4350433.1 hypothetical protein N0V89_009054 [Didymosphaeria variabile]